MLILTGISLLLLAFLVHILWWRIKFPNRSTIALLSCFACVYFIFIICSYLFFPMLVFKLPDLFKLSLFYLSCAFVYIIVYSAVEDQSPTLAIAYYLNKQKGKGGCNDNALNNLLRADEGIQRRISSMEKSGFIEQRKNCWYLTEKGKFFALLFDYSAKLFGVRGMGG